MSKRQKTPVELIRAHMIRSGWKDKMYGADALAAQELAIYAYNLGVRRRRALGKTEKP